MGPTSIGGVARTGAISFFIVMGGLLFVENIAQMGVTMPAFVKKYLLVLKEKTMMLIGRKMTKASRIL
ncbi:phage holin family protein [Bacillus cihuensis]|uniref:phage holin family protein n=1 Tax=Bacillus cihuensis TaxID=1208599 RepID=UPI000424E940|nr:phage holin family protein [Bacillus cihuensis]